MKTKETNRAAVVNKQSKTHFGNGLGKQKTMNTPGSFGDLYKNENQQYINEGKKVQKDSKANNTAIVDISLASKKGEIGKNAPTVTLPRHQIDYTKSMSINDVSFDLIRIPDWFSKKYISRAEVNRCLDAIKAGGIGLPDILLRYCRNDNGEKYYELIDGIVTLTAYQELGIISHSCKVVDNPNFSTTDAILVALSLNTREVLSPWESTIMGLDFLIKTFGYTTEKVRSYRSKITGEWYYDTYTPRDKAVGICRQTLNFRRSSVKLSSEQKLENEEYKSLIERITPEVEAKIDLMLSHIGIDLTTFVERRCKLLDLPVEIKKALESGKLHYTKAISISHIGATNELKAIVGALGDKQMLKKIEIEIDDLLRETIDKNLSNKEVVKKVHQANARLLAYGTDPSYSHLSDEKIGDRAATREDLKLQANLKQDLATVTRFVKKVDFMHHLSEVEKSNLQKKVAQLDKMIQGLSAKYYQEDLALTLC